MPVLDEESYKDLSGLVDEVERDLIELERFKDDKDLLDRMLRNLHTLKGTVAMFGLDDLRNVSHKMEDYLKGVEEKSYPISPSSISVLSNGANTLYALLKQAAGMTKQSTDPAPIIDVLEKIMISPDEPVQVEAEKSRNLSCI